MRNFDRSLIAGVLCLAGVAVAPVVACSTSNPDTSSDAGSSGDEGGLPVLPDGATPDGSVVDPPKKCAKAADCPSGVCNQAAGLCVAATCTDGVKNAIETDIDCGGDCPRCDVQKTCKVAADCTSGVCKDTGTGLKCQAPTNTDGVKNGNETGIDCGGTGNNKCPDGQGCKTLDDCTSDYCKAGICTAILPGDGVKNGTETDIDCGGVGNARCADNLMCLVAADCKSSVCKDVGLGLRCQPPSYTDGVKNGNETDLDCGGDPTKTYLCGTGLNCLVGDDCTSLGCDYNNKCAPSRSCTTHYGGDTCGSGGAGGVGAQAWESCCTTIPVPATGGGTVYMDKYPTTAGRMRVFLEAIGYDVRTAVQTMRAAGQIPVIPINANTGAPALDGVNPVLDPSWDMFLPTSFDGNGAAPEISDCGQSGTCVCAGPGCPATNTGECNPSTTCIAGTEQPGMYSAVRNHLGGNIFKNNSQTATGCFVGGPGTHSFRFPDAKQDGLTPEQPVELYDTKTLNCVDYLMGQAFCVWDGGRLETFQEWQTAWGPGGTTPYTAMTALTPAEPNQRCDLTGATGAATSCTVATSATDCKTATTALTCNGATSKCCLQGGPAPNANTVGGGDKTYWGCRFPWATDASHGACGVTWPATTSIEYSDYKYSYEYPKLGSNDYIVHLSAPGRTAGRGPLGHSDLIGTGFELTSSVTWKAWNPAVPNSGPFQATHRWTGNGSWEVHGYSRGYTGTSELLNKYGKLGVRCVKNAPN